MYKKAFELSYKNKKVEIEIQDFVGDVRNINGTEDLFSLSYISDSKDKGQSILVTEADINFYADDYFNIDELKTVGETDIKVKYYEDDNLHWSGFVIPDFFSTSVDTAPVVSMVATDRIGTLKEISNNAESNIPIQILASCLKQTGQDLPINLITDNNHFETPIQLERIEDIASYDVIRTFMVLFNCKITLYKNAWWIVNKKLLESGFVNYKSYNSNGVGGSVTPFAQPILDIDLVDRDGQREIKPTASEISLFLEFGGSKKYPKNWNFEKWNESSFNDWTAKNGFIPKLNTKQITGYTFANNYYKAIFGADIERKSLHIKQTGGTGTIGNYYTRSHYQSSFEKIPFNEDGATITVQANITTPSGKGLRAVPFIKIPNINPSQNEYYAISSDGSVSKVGTGSSIDLSKIKPISINNSVDDSAPTDAIEFSWSEDFKIIPSQLNVGRSLNAEASILIFEGRIDSLNANDADIFIHSIQLIFNKNEQVGKGLIFKTKQGGEKFSKSRETETILFSDKINQGVNGYFYNYKYDDTSIVDLPSEFALSSVRERADMFSKARDYYSLDGDFIVNPLAKYVCGSKSFVLVGGENRREDASIIIEEIVSNTLNRTDFIYTYFDDGKDKVKTIGTASGGSSSGGGGGSSPSVPQLIKEDENGNYYSEEPFYSLGGLSAFGFSEVGDGTGGDIFTVVDNLNFTGDDLTKVLSARQGNVIKQLIDNLKVGEGGTISVAWDDLIGKPNTFTPSAHTHIIGDVTGLQGELDDKASLSQLDDKEDKFTKNSAFNKNFGTGLNDVARGNHTHAFASLTSIPTTLAGYGITDGASKVHTHAISDVTNLQAELNKRATNTALTTHVNKTDNPHSVTKSQVGLGNVANKDLSNVDNIQQATKTEFTSHKNLFDSMFRKVGTNIEAKLSLYSLGGLSAYGFSEEGSETGGGIVNILPSWESYTSDKSGWALSAGLGVDLNNRKADKTWVESLLEDYVPTDTKYTAGRGLTLTGTVFSTSFDIANYATVTALGGKVDKVTGKSLISDVEITRLAGVTNQTRASLNITNVDNTSDANKPISNATQTALNSKLATSIFNTHNTDNIRHITGAERTKWNGVVTDFAGLEIGGRNLILNSTEDTKNYSGSPAFLWSRLFLLSEKLIVGQKYTFSIGNIEGAEFNFISLRNPSGVKLDLTGVIGFTPNREDIDRLYVYYKNYPESGNVSIRNIKLEKGNKATDWTPAPEDQVSDWLTTDVNSFSFIKNKPTLLSQFIDNIGVAQHRIDFDAFKTTFDTMFRKTPTNEIEAKLSLYTLGGLSAYGFSDEGSSGGGGGIVNILSDWAIYDASKSGWALSAGLGKGLYDNKADKTDPRFTDARTPLSHTHIISDVTGLQGALNAKTNQTFSDGLNQRLTSIEGGSATTVNVSGAGDLLASVSKVGNNINFIKGNQSWGNLSGKPSTFVPSAHTHAISDVTNLQTTLNGKLETTVFNTHNNDNVRHITGVERTKWDTVVTDFAGLEIGGRNLITGSKEFKGFYIEGQSVEPERYKGFKVYSSKGNWQKLLQNVSVNKGIYTFSCYAKLDETSIKSVSFYAYPASLYSKITNIKIGNLKEGWRRVSCTVEVDEDIQKGSTRDEGFSVRLEGWSSNADDYKLYQCAHKLEKGTIPTDWTPAPEDQVSDWNTTDVNSFSFIKNKPTMLSQFIDNIGVAQHRIDFDAFKTTFDTMFRKTPTNEIEAKLSLYTLGGLSAYGFSDEGSSGGGGGIVNILSDWAIYDASKSGWALSAGLGKGLYDNKADKTDPRFTDARTPLSHTHIISDVTGLQGALNAKTNQTFSDGLNQRLTSIEGGSATTVNVSGAGDLLASVSKVGNNINFIKGNQSWGNLSGKPSTFVPSAHTHAISDVTNLQTTLNGKLETTVFNAHNTDNVRHITGVERTKWDGVVTDFEGLEIGGRNLAKGTNQGKSNWIFNMASGSRTVESLVVDGVDSVVFRRGEDVSSGWYYIGYSDIGRDKLRGGEYITVSFDVLANVTTHFKISLMTGGSQYNLEESRVYANNRAAEGEWSKITATLKLKDVLPPQTDQMLFLSSFNRLSNVEYVINNLVISKGTKATDWSPAPEDQVSDWLTTDVDSFSFIKNKPTLLSQFTDNIGVASHIANKSNPHNVTKAQVGLSNVDNAKQATKVEFDLFKSSYDEMFRKVGTSIEAKLPLYSLGGLSAYGFSDEGSSSGSGIVNILPSWESYDTSKSGWALSAGLGENLRTRVVALENAEIDLSGYATLNYVNDKVKTNVPLNAKFTDTIVDISGKVDKKTGFSLVADTEITRLSSVTNQDLSSYAKTSDVNNLLGGKVDKVTGKSLISDTEITRLSSVTNQDLTPYALKTYVDTEVGKKWTYNETTIKAVKVSNAVRADNVGGFTVGVNVPSNAKFTDTIVDISGKVDKVTGKGLSTNDFTTVEKNKLAILENQTRASLGVENVTNESKLTMFANPTFTGTTKVTILELNSNWKVLKSGNELEFRYNNVKKATLTPNGDLIVMGGMTAYQ